jgi:hypothetical protein
LLGAILLAGLKAAGGCTRRTALVREPPAPYFGPRVSSPGAMPVARSPAPQAPPVRQAFWGEAAWDVNGPQRQWRFIVIHHSATVRGSAAEFDRMHRSMGWDELGYHFVIGNGTASGDGQVEVGSRWLKQKHGAHCKVTGHPEYNDVGIGVCLVGNFNEQYPSAAQMDSLVRVVRHLMMKYDISTTRIFGHRDVKATDCPGRHVDVREVVRRL